MNVKSVEKKEKNTAELTVEVSAEKFEEAVNAAYKKNKSKIAIPGFRKGKAPRKIIENMYGASLFYEDAVEILYPEAFEFAVAEEKLNIVGQPGLLDVDISDDKKLTMKYAVSLYPEVKLGEYKGLSGAKPAVKVFKKEIDEEVETMRKRNARIEVAERAAKDGDTANIDFEGFLEGVPFDGGKGEGFNLVLGSGQFVPGFEEQVVGMSAGEEKEINITFPENYTAELAGKPVVFKVKVNEVKESILPELDDEFAKDVSEFDTLEEYKNSVKERLTEQKKAEIEKSFKDEIITKVVDNMECEVPDAMVDERVESTIQSYNYNLSAQGLTFENYLQMMGMNIDEFRTTMRPAAEKQVKIDLAIEKIAEVEDFSVSEEEIEAEYKTLAEKYKVEAEEAKKFIPEDSIKKQIQAMKAEELVFSSAVVEKKAAKKSEKEEKADEKDEKAE